MNINGTNQTRITNNTASDNYPKWARPVYVAPKTVTLTSPNGAESFAHSTNQNITWTSSSVTNVKLEYTTDNGTNWTTIIASTPASAGTYSWLVPIRPSANCKVRVSDAANASVNDASNGVFTILETTGNTILFASERDGNSEIYVMNSDGTNQTRLTINGAGDYYPSWSPDGTQIAFTTDRDVNWEIYVMNADGTNQRNLTNNTSTDWNPSWSPYGTQIAFASVRDGNQEIYVMNADGSNQRRLTNNSADDYYISWSPDGTQIAFTSKRDGNYETYVMNADGSNQRRLTNNSAYDGAPSWSPDGTQIAFLSDRDGNYEIYVMNADGSNQRNLTKNSVVDDFPSWSPDGSQIAFVSPRDGNNEIYVMNADGSNQTRLTNNTAYENFPKWARPVYHVMPTLTLTSPNGGESWTASTNQNITWTSTGVSNVKIEYSTNNGTNWTTIIASTPASAGYYSWLVPIRPSANCKVRVSDAANASVNDASNGAFTIAKGAQAPIAFYSYRDGNWEIYVMNPDGSNQTRLTNNPATDGHPTWSPDGSKIAFESYRDGNYEIYVMNADGSNQTRLTNTTNNDFVNSSAWSLDGSKIAFGSYIDGNNEIYLMNADGSNQTRLTNNSADDQMPSLSPDGSKIAFNSNRDGNFEIYVMNYDGSNQTRLTSNSADDYYPSWSPDGSKIAFNSTRNGANEIYLMNADGSNQTRLTNNTTDYYSSWSSDGFKITFSSNRDGNPEIYVMNAEGSNQTRLTNNTSDDVSPSWQKSTSVFVTAPNGGEFWTAGTTKTITWVKNGVTNIKLEYTTNNGTSWNTIIASTEASAGSYAWTVPNTPSATCLVRISDASNATVNDQSNAVFTILGGTITVTSPNGGENWPSSTTKTITWTSTGITNVKIEYSTNSGTSWSSVIASTPASSGTYSWTVPNTPSATCLVRVSDASNAAIADPSNALFTISPVQVTVTSPNGGETWKKGIQQAITWTAQNVSNVKIEYTTDGGTAWKQVTASTGAAAGTYQWTVPEESSTTCKVRITDTSNAAVADMSDATFTLKAPLITIVAPVSGESWKSGTQQNIRWTASDVATVKIEYTTDGGTAWQTAVASTAAAAGTYLWTVPSVTENKTSCKIRISDTTDTAVFVMSQGAFSIIQPKVTVTAPNGGEQWGVKTVQTIRWTASDVATVKIEYSTNSGAAWTTIVASTEASAGTYQWTVPTTATNTCLVRVSDASNAAVVDQSDAVFAIKPAVVAVTSPNGGETWSVGTQKPITWTSQYVSTVKIEYSTDSGSAWATIIASTNAAAGTYQWTVPSTPSTGCLVRVTDTTDATVWDKSDGVFTIQPQTITVLAPAGGESWRVGKVYEIKWSAPNVTTVKIEYSTDSGAAWTQIATNVNATTNTNTATGSYQWTIPSVEPNKYNCLVRVSSTADATVNGKSDGVFTIGKPSLKLVAPVGGENYRAGSPQEIKWTSEIVANVKLELSTNRGTSWTMIAANANAVPGVYAWAVPTTPSDSCLVRLTDVLDPLIQAQSASVFRISVPSITVVAPNGGEIWQIGKNAKIVWKSVHVNSVKIELSIDGGFNWNPLETNVTAKQDSITIIVPNTPSQYCVVRITDENDGAIKDRSEASFTIVKELISVMSPNGGERWRVGLKQNITWESVGNRTIRLEYTSDGGVTWKTLATSLNASLGKYEWTVPDTPSKTCLMKVTDTQDAAVTDQSNELFWIIKPTLILTSPKGGEVWKVGTTCEIAWVAVDVERVKIEVSRDRGTTWTAIADSVNASAGRYEWKVPDTTLPSDNCLLRISDAYDTSVKYLMTATFRIVKPQITLIVPIGGEKWVAGTIQDIKWRSSYIDAVNLEYSTDNSATWKEIATDFRQQANVTTTASQTGSYSWTLPDVSSKECFVRVAAGSLSAKNTAPFTIVSSFAVIKGRVTDARSGLGIPYVTVTISQKHTAATGSDGSYELLQVEHGEYTIRVTKTGYIDKAEERVPVSPGDVIERNFVLTAKSGPVATDLRVTPNPTSGSSVITVEGIVRTNMTAKIAPFTGVEKIAAGDASSLTGAEKAAVQKKAIQVDNNFVMAQVSDDGEFAIWTKDNKRLLDGGTSSVTLIRIEGATHAFGGSDGTWTTPLYATSNQVRGIWTLGGIEVTYTLSIIQGTTTRQFDTFRVCYELKNTGTVAHSAGLFKGFDAMINTNDGSPVSASEYSRRERSFTGTDVPNFWQAYEDAPDQPSKKLIVQGTLNGGGAVKPERFVVGDWSKLRVVTWEYTASGDYTDSGVGIWWEPVDIVAGESRSIATLYGLGAVNTVVGDVAMSVTSEKTLSVVDNKVNPNPFQVTAIVTNRRGMQVTDIKAAIVLPQGLSLADGENETKTIGTLVNGGSGQAVWRVVAEEYGADQAYFYKVQCGNQTGNLSSAIMLNSVTVPGVLRGLYVRGAELYLDGNDSGAGNGIAMQVSDGQYDGAVEAVKKTVNISNLTVGKHTVYVRGRDSEGDWGDVTACEFTVSAPLETNITVYPDAESKVYARRVLKVPVILDMSASTYKAGEFQVFVTWPSDLLAFVSVNAGTDPGGGVSQGALVTQTDNTDNGELMVSYLNTRGLDGKSTMFILMFHAIGGGGRQGTVNINLTSLSSITTFTNLLPMTKVTDYRFTIVDTSIWGDVDDNESVQNRDAFIIMTYSVGRDVANYRDYILQRGDVNADNTVNTTDALICKSYSIDPTNPNLPVRVGQPMGSVPKIAESSGVYGQTLEPVLTMSRTEDGFVMVETAIDAGGTGALIGAADVIITWDPVSWRFGSVGDGIEDVVVNTDRASAGEIRIAKINVAGNYYFVLPRILLMPLKADDSGGVYFRIVQAASAETFETLAVNQELNDRDLTKPGVKPVMVVLRQNTPNPFNPTTTITYELNEPSYVRLAIYNTQGQLVKTLVDRYESPGLHTLTWDARDERGAPVSSGVYIYQVQTSKGRDQKQMLFLR